MNEQNWNEERTRKEFIDKLLTGSGWGPIVRFVKGKQFKNSSVEEYEMENGPAEQIEKRYNKAKAYVDKLTQSILAKAFRGELVPQDPSDEPADVLVERIKIIKSQTQSRNFSKATSSRKLQPKRAYQ